MRHVQGSCPHRVNSALDAVANSLAKGLTLFHVDDMPEASAERCFVCVFRPFGENDKYSNRA